MNQQQLGKTILKLRKKQGITQSQLAEILNVSNKAVSKWENGRGYPDISLLPILAQTFGITIDYLLKEDNQGIAVAGNVLVDIVNIVDSYPERNMLAKVLGSSRAVGGCVPNTIIDLAKIDSNIFLNAIGKVGEDENGRYVISQLNKYGIDTSGIVVDSKMSTSYTNVMTDSVTRERTFFYASGGDGLFDVDDVDVDKLDCKIFHIGYILLLPLLDSYDEEYGTRMARLLDKVSQKGIKVSIDIVSNDSGKVSEKVVPVLKYCNYVIMNEIECCMVCGLSPRNADGSLCIENIKLAMEKFFEYGVKEKVIIHCSEGGFLLNKDGSFYKSGSFILPDGYIKGSTGAGDAYAAACLYGLFKGMEPEYMLDFAAAAAVCNLAEADSISGMKNKSEIKKIMLKYKKRDI